MTAPSPLSSVSLSLHVAASALRAEAYASQDLARGLRSQVPGGLTADALAAHPSERLARHHEARARLYERCGEAAERCGAASW